jgi:nitrate reductase delta subunit
LRLTLKTLSIIFDYPGPELREMAARRGDLVKALRLEDPEAADAIERFLGEVDPERADEDYVAVFEVPPKCSLYAHTYLLKGKEDLVGQMLLEVKAQYKAKGVDVPVKREIPTYLPVMLEYLAVVYDDDPQAARRFVRKYLAPWVGELERCLAKEGSPWVHAARALRIVVERIAGGGRGR